MASSTLLSVEILCKCCLKPMPASQARFNVNKAIREAFKQLTNIPLDRDHPDADFGFICTNCYMKLNNFEAFRREVASAHSKKHPVDASMAGSVAEEFYEKPVDLEQLKLLNLLELRPKESPKKQVPLTVEPLPNKSDERPLKIEIVPCKSFKKMMKTAKTSTPKKSSTVKQHTLGQSFSSSSTDTALSSEPSSEESKKLVIDETPKEAQTDLFRCQCQYCGAETVGAEAFFNHMSEKHYFLCEQCAKSFPGEVQLNEHIASVHGSVEIINNEHAYAKVNEYEDDQQLIGYQPQYDSKSGHPLEGGQKVVYKQKARVDDQHYVIAKDGTHSRIIKINDNGSVVTTKGSGQQGYAKENDDNQGTSDMAQLSGYQPHYDSKNDQQKVPKNDVHQGIVKFKTEGSGSQGHAVSTQSYASSSSGTYARATQIETARVVPEDPRYVDYVRFTEAIKKMEYHNDGVNYSAQSVQTTYVQQRKRVDNADEMEWIDQSEAHAQGYADDIVRDTNGGGWNEQDQSRASM